MCFIWISLFYVGKVQQHICILDIWTPVTHHTHLNLLAFLLRSVVLACFKFFPFPHGFPSHSFTSYHRHHSNTSLLLCLHLREREIEKFRMAVSISSGSRISFSLSYEELLPRRLGRYELILGLRPGGLVTNLTLDVSIAERTGLSFIKVLPLKTSRLLSNTVTGNIGKGSSYSLLSKL